MHVYGRITGKLVSSGTISGSLAGPVTIAGNLTVPEYILPPAYTGDYEVTPSGETQTLATDSFYMTGNITINPIPSNYGLITWNGSTLTVS